MSATTVVTPTFSQGVQDEHRAPVPFPRLLRSQLRALATQRSVVALTALSVVLGVASLAVAIMIGGGVTGTAAAVEDKVRVGSVGYSLLWIVIGTLAAAAPYRSGWISLILSIAPSRRRWLTASYLSVVVWVVGATAVFTALAMAAAAVCLGALGRDVTAATGVLGYLPNLTVSVLLGVTLGFVLGAAFRAVTVPIMLGYVVPSFVPLLDMVSKDVDRWLDVNTATAVLARTQEAPYGLGPVLVALSVWMVVPAVVAAVRLHRADLR